MPAGWKAPSAIMQERQLTNTPIHLGLVLAAALAEDVLDTALAGLVLAVDAFDVDTEHDGGAVSGPFGDLGRGDARAEPGGRASWRR
jgi:hypothetical protein